MKMGGLKIKREELAERLISFCMTNGLLSDSEIIDTTAEMVAGQLESRWFLEKIITMLMARANYMDSADLRQLKELITELQEIKTDLEYYEQ